MISNRPAVPLLVHEDCMGDINANVEEIVSDTSSIRTSSSNTATQLSTIKADTTTLTSSVGTTADESTANTVIGLLKSIVNKLS